MRPTEAREVHTAPIQVLIGPNCRSIVVTAAVHTTPKNNNKQKKAVKPSQKPRPPRICGRGAYTYETPGPWGRVGRDVGSLLGGHYLGAPGKAIGEKLGSYAHYIGKIFGSGDYVVGPGIIGRNNLVNPEQVPEFQNGDNTVRIAHREYICDIYSSATPGAFLRYDFPLNPGLSSTFPWAGQVIGGNFQQHSFNGLVFEFHSNSSEYTTQLNAGYVVMATDYDSTDVPFTSKLQMENTQYAVSGKPSRNMLHAIECDRKQTTVSNLYVRSGAAPSGTDLRMYDLGRLSVGVGGITTPNVMIGELWASYDLLARKPIQMQPAAYLPMFKADLSLTTQGNAPLTLTPAGKFDTIGVTITSGTTMTLPYTIPLESIWCVHYATTTDASGAAIAYAPNVTGSNGLVTYTPLPGSLWPNPTPSGTVVRGTGFVRYLKYTNNGGPGAPPTITVSAGGPGFAYCVTAHIAVTMMNGAAV